MSKELIQAIYEALPKKHLAAYHGEAAANVAAYQYLLNNYGDNDKIAQHLTSYHNIGYAEYDAQYTKVLTAYLG